ncbi:MAG TPA: hypothetical protein DIU07_03330 [Rhodobacteraceae bacterium]|nr:hypothetical protein [Paracoccaceae bacterium]
MREADVTLTDFGLAALCFGFTGVLIGGGDIAALFAGLYAALGVAALLGALSHGWFWDRTRDIGRATWLVTMLVIGGANLFLWLISARAFAVTAPWGAVIAFGQFALYASLALFITRSFLLSSGFSLPPTLALLAGFLWTGNWLGATGLAVALAGAVQQAAGIRGLGLTHNALYHVIQALAFILVYLAVPDLAASLEAR